ncbi:MAG: hypothetical protein IFK94_05625 [Acidobacteria bacterium]|uniref:Fibronectin type-III domain-containing protein n=1 Tax=Candidatus Polarisedimenticola svalbardensis TaxID=2886004 RepID=A0A8J6Y7Q6_9BACT|nr:hypothetical protein [Candidatus Polarisedimenticola svalbardensis]
MRLHDGLNTEERILFTNPIAGRWVIRVTGVDVPWGPQPFALVVRGALTDCAAPPPPGAPVLTTPADRQVGISWGAVSGAASYNVYRSFGACPGGPWIPVATGITGTSFLDTTVSGGVTYSYRVTASSDGDGYCESPPSPCNEVAPTGECTLLPDFRGIATAGSEGTASCATTLNWDAGAALCAGDLVYNVYRGSNPGFEPTAASRIASCVTGTTYTDSANLVHGATYHYLVRAEDATTGHGGPCRDGNQELNLARAETRPFGPPELGTWNDDAGDNGEATFDPGPGWQVEPAGGDTGPAFTNWTRLPLSPDYPALINSPYFVCDTTQSITNYFSDIDMTYDTYTASLVNWVGGDVKLRFHLSGDLYFPGGNWWIDDVQVTQVGVPGSCSTTAAGPPPIPDGGPVPGSPLLVAKSGGDLALTWDDTTCPATEVNIYRGSIGDYSTFTGGHCGQPPTGSATVAMPDNSWFLVVATDGVYTDGSWSRDVSGAELDYSGASLACPAITNHTAGGVCP